MVQKCPDIGQFKFWGMGMCPAMQDGALDLHVSTRVCTVPEPRQANPGLRRKTPVANKPRVPALTLKPG